MALDSEETKIVELLSKHPQGLGQNELYDRLQGEMGKGTLSDRLKRLKAKQRVDFAPAIRNGKIWALTDYAKATSVEWKNHIGEVISLTEGLARILRSPMPSQEKLTRGLVLYRRQMSVLLVEDVGYRHFKLSEAARQTQYAFHGMIIQDFYYAIDGFVAHFPRGDDFMAAMLASFPGVRNALQWSEEETRMMREIESFAQSILLKSFPEMQKALARYIDAKLPLPKSP